MATGPSGKRNPVATVVHSVGTLMENNTYKQLLRGREAAQYDFSQQSFETINRDTLAVLDRAPTPTEGRALTPGRVRTALRAGGRTRNIDVRAQAIVEGLRADRAGTAEDDEANG